MRFDFPVASTFLIRRVAVLGDSVIEFAVWAVIDEGADRNTSDQLRNAADMIFVVMREQHVVDLRKPGLFRDCDDAVRVATSCCPCQPVSISSDCPAGVTNSVDWPPSTSTK